MTLILVLALAVCLTLAAQATGTGNELIPGYTGIVTRSGGVLGNVPAQADYVVNNFSATKILSGTYRVGLRLADDAGNRVSAEAFSAPFSLTLLPRGSSRGTISLVLTPDGLMGGAPYHVASQLYATDAVSGRWTAIGVADISDPYRFAVVDAGTDSGVVAWLNVAAVTRAYAVATASGIDSFQVRAQGVLGRLDQPTQPVETDNDQLFLNLTLEGARSGPILLTSPRTSVAIALPNHTPDGRPAAVTVDQTLDVHPAVQLDSTDSYTLTVSASHAGPDGTELADQTVVLGSQRLLHFNGTVKFGSLLVTLTSIFNDPAPEGTVAGVGENTELQIGDNGAYLNASPSYHIISGQTLHVVLGIDGTATSSDPAEIVVPAASLATVAGVSFALDGVTIDSAGGHATGGTVRFPAGFGVAGAPNIRRLNAAYPLGPLDLDASMSPMGVVELSPSKLDAQVLYAVHEDLPEVFEASSISWDTGAGTFTAHRTGTRHVRADETAALDGLALTTETLIAKSRPSNDGYLGSPGSGAGVDVVVRADAQGRAILDDARIDLPPSQFTAHFPADVVVAWSQPGQLVIKGGAIDTDRSALPGAADAAFGTLPGAPGLTLVGGLDTFAFTPSGTTWNFTADGGLHAEGTIGAGKVRWGARSATEFAQTSGIFAVGAAHLPGTVLRGAIAATTGDQKPGELLLSGQGKPGEPTYQERPGTASYYAAGLADSPGLNVRALGDGSQAGTSLLGDAILGPYPLAATTKYYIRKAGLSGIHAADRTTVGGVAGSLVMHGFHLALSDYQLAYRDNRVVDSLVAGTVDVPGARGKPGFSQPFEKLFMDPQGEPGEMTLPQDGALEHPLAYWHAQFHPITAEFVAATTGPKTTALVFGAEVLLPGVLKDPVRGGLGFFPTGKLVAAKDGIPGVNSRMKPPKRIALHGPGSAVNPTIPAFTVNPVTDFYFNDPEAESAPDDGFVAFAGTIDVPFFEDLKVHVLARADTGRTSVRAGWTDGKSDFFNDHNFDSGNVGFPLDKKYPAYVNEDEPAGFLYYDENDPAHNQRNPYNPIARQSWLGSIDFALPVKWDPARRRFLSSVPEEREFLVMSSQRTIQQLTPSGAEIRFGLQFNNLPRLNLTSLFISDREATQELIKFIPDGAKLANAAAAFGTLLDGNSDKLVDQGVDGVLDQFLDYLLAPSGPLHDITGSAEAAAAIGAPKTPTFETIRDQLKSQLAGVIGTVTEANSVVGQLANGLDAVDGALGSADTLLKRDLDGKRGAFITDAVGMAASLGIPTEEVSQVTDSITTELNGELAPTLDDVQRSLEEVHALTKSARGLVDGVRQVTQGALDVANVSGALPDDVLVALRDYLQKAHDPTGRLLAEMDPGQLRSELKRAVKDVIGDSGFLAEIKQTVTELVEPLPEEYSGMYEQLFGVLNDVVRSALEELSDQVVDHLNETAGKANRAIGGFRKTLEMTKIEGSARILGDVIDSAHLNATLGLHVPDKVTLLGTVDFKRLHSDQPVPPCVSGNPDGRIQITVTARGDASLGGCQAGHAELHGQYTMNARGEPLALSGGMSLNADVHVDIVALKKADFEFAFGPGDNYVRAEGAGSILVFDVNTRAFFGRTCDPGLVAWIDPQIDALFSTLGRPAVDAANPLTGYYMMADGDVLLNRIFDIPDSVVLLKASGGQGSFMFCNTGLTAIIPGMHWRLGIGVRLGPASARAELVALGGMAPIPLGLSVPDGLPQMVDSFLKDPSTFFRGAITGRFTPKFSVGPASWSQDFDFTAEGHYVPPPLAPPPGYISVEKLRF